MSRAFLKNESADDPVVIPARAPLPPGTTNYVTPRGLALLRSELDELETERTHVQANEIEETARTRRLAELNGRIANLSQRIASAKVIDVQEHPQNDVRFGATVSLLRHTSKAANAYLQITIVGVDEADAKHGLIAFTAPLARLLLSKRVGEFISLRTAQGESRLEIKGISYDEKAPF